MLHETDMAAPVRCSSWFGGVVALLGRRDLQVGEVATLPPTHPRPDPATLPFPQLFDDQARFLSVVDVYAYLRLLDHDPGVEPGIPVRRRNDRLLVPPRLVVAEHLPAVLRVGD